MLIPTLVFIQWKNKYMIWDTCKEHNGAVILNEQHTQENSDFLQDNTQTEKGKLKIYYWNHSATSVFKLLRSSMDLFFNFLLPSWKEHMKLFFMPFFLVKCRFYSVNLFFYCFYLFNYLVIYLYVTVETYAEELVFNFWRCLYLLVIYASFTPKLHIYQADAKLTKFPA